MKTMTDFVNTISVHSPQAVYNEEYTWAGEYAEYYNESSDMYVGDILNSSGYQFFGEAALSPRKSFITAGILALVSGAFFMIMKLLNGDGSGGSGGSSSNPEKALAQTIQHADDVQNAVSKKAEQSKKNLEKSFDGLEKAGADVSDARNILNGGNKSKSESSKDSEYVDPKAYESEDELEKKAVYVDLKGFEALIKKYKKEKKTKVAVPGGAMKLYIIERSLKQIDAIVHLMRDQIKEHEKDGDFSWFTSKAFKDKEYELNKELTVKNVKLEGEREDLEISEVEGYFKSIQNLIKSINDDCKEGMKICRRLRQQKIDQKKPVEHIDIAFNTLKKVLKDVSVVAKMINEKSLAIAPPSEKSENNKKANTPVGNLYADIGKNMNKLEGVIGDSYLSGLKKAYEKGLKVLNDPDDDDEDAFSPIYMSLINVWKSQNEISNDNLKRLISFMNSIGFKEVNISKGQKLKQKDGRYFKDIYIQPTDDASLDYIIKGIFEHPMEMHITLDGDDFNAILPGNASMYRVKG